MLNACCVSKVILCMCRLVEEQSYIKGLYYLNLNLNLNVDANITLEVKTSLIMCNHGNNGCPDWYSSFKLVHQNVDSYVVTHVDQNVGSC